MLQSGEMTFKQVFILRIIAILFVGTVFTYLSVQADESVPGNVGSTYQVTSTLSTVSLNILARNINRKYLLIQNQGASTVNLKLGSVQSGSEGIALTAGSSYSPNPPIVDAIWAKNGAGVVNLYIIEGTK